MRLAPLRKADLVGEQAELYDALVTKSVGRDESHVLDATGAVKGPLAVLLRHPASGRALQQLAVTLRFEGLLPDAAREAVILVVAGFWGDDHEWRRHADIGRAAGITGEQMRSIAAQEAVEFEDPITQAAHDAAAGMVRRSDLTDEEYGRVHAVLGDERLVEVSAIVGYYGLLSLQLRVFRVPADHD